MCRLFVLGFPLLLCGICFGGAAQTEPSNNLREVLAHDGRTAHDVAVFNLRQIAAPQTWVVAEAEPDPFNPSPLIPYSNDNGIWGHGSITVLSRLTGDAPPLTRYQWEWKPEFFHRFGGEEEGSNDFFRYGPDATTIVRINEETSPDHKFFPAYLIPREWAAFVAPALKVQANTDELTPESIAAHRAQLEASLSDENPFVAIEAARNLGRAHLLGTDFVRGPLAKSRGFEQSAFVFLVLQQVSATKTLAKEPRLEAFGKIIDNVPNAETLKSFLVGIYAHRTEPSPDTLVTAERIKTLLRRVDARQKALGTHTAADAYLDLLLHINGVRQASAVSGK